MTYRPIAEHVDEVVTVTDNEIAASVLVLLERAKQVIEGAGASPVATLLGDDLDVTGETVMALLSEGNLDMTMIQTFLVHALTDRAQILTLKVMISDVPGKMENITEIVPSHGANIQTVRHNRSETDLSVGEAYLVFRVETSGSEHAREIVQSVADHGYDVEHVNRGRFR